VVMMPFVYVLYQRGSNQSGIVYCFGANRSWKPHASVFVFPFGYTPDDIWALSGFAVRWQCGCRVSFVLHLDLSLYPWSESSQRFALNFYCVSTYTVKFLAIVGHF